ncbi:MAG: hypothetical protein ACLFRP_08960 [Puniceicoccaceae bacterium]
MPDSETDSEPSRDPRGEENRTIVRPRLVVSKKKTVFVFARNEGADEEEEEEEEAGDFYDFTEINTKFRIVNDLDD